MCDNDYYYEEGYKAARGELGKLRTKGRKMETVNAELLDALEKAKGAVEFLACATDSDPEDHELLEVVNKAIDNATKEK